MALVVLLRGVNVGGHRTFRPSTLAEQLKHLDAINIGAAGTFVIRRPVAREQLRAELARRLPFDTAIMICEGREIIRLMSHNHFADQPLRPDIVRFVSVLAQRPHSAPSMPMFFPSSGKWLLKNPHEGRPVRLRPLPAPHEGHQLSRHVRPHLWSAGHHAQLEHHHRDLQGAG